MLERLARVLAATIFWAAAVTGEVVSLTPVPTVEIAKGVHMPTVNCSLSYFPFARISRAPSGHISPFFLAVSPPRSDGVVPAVRAVTAVAWDMVARQRGPVGPVSRGAAVGCRRREWAGLRVGLFQPVPRP